MAGRRDRLRLGLAFLAGLVLPALLFLLVGAAGLFPVDATSMPSRAEAQLAGLFVRRSLAREAAKVVVPPAPHEDTTFLAGMRTFRRNCAGCHGKFGARSRWGTTSFYPRVPQFADEGSTLRPAEMFVAVKHGIRGTGMDLLARRDSLGERRAVGGPLDAKTPGEGLQILGLQAEQHHVPVGQ